jgi:ribosome-binding ATPase YchF (GTP1/OBG family)
MKVGIAGFSGSGKSVVFQWLTGVAPDPGKAQHGQLGIARVPDARLDWLSNHFKPKKTTHATLEMLDTPGLLLAERKDNARRLGIMRDAGALLVVLNGFSGGEPATELERFREEILFADLDIVTGRIARLEDGLKKPRPAKQKEADQAELDLLRRIAGVLEAGKSAATLGLKEEEEKTVRSFQLLTLKPEMVLVNVSEDRLGQELPARLRELAPEAKKSAVRFQLELADLPEEDRAAFAHDFLAGATDTGMSRDDLLRHLFYGSGQNVFFTIGEDECRAWPLPKGANAVEAAGQIHTDLARGFVRGEVVTFEDFKRVGSMKEAKNQGVYRLEGKTYVLSDGDIMHVLASG